VAEVQTKKRPITITIVGWLFIAVGALSTAAHYADFRTHRPMVNEVVWITALGAAAIVAGAFILRGHNWARWLAIAWMASHVILIAFHLLHGLLIHSVLFVLICCLLFQREAREYFNAA
jgi:vacuolar-type H+-ATPase subunit I/STV1